MEPEALEAVRGIAGRRGELSWSGVSARQPCPRPSGALHAARLLSARKPSSALTEYRHAAQTQATAPACLFATLCFARS